MTGATGFLGSHVCDVLLAAGSRVRAAHRPTSNQHWLHGKDLETVEVDLADPASLDRFLDGCTGVIHCAGVVMADEATYRRVNVEGTRLMLEAASRAGTVDAFVLISSMAAGGPAAVVDQVATTLMGPIGGFLAIIGVIILPISAGGPAGLDAPRDETMPDAPITGYGRSKHAAEALLREANWPMRTVSLRPPSLYGPRDRGFGPLLRAGARGWTGRFGRRMQGLSLVHGADAAAAAVALLATGTATGFYYVDDGAGHHGPSHPGRRWPWGYDFDEVRSVLTVLFARTVRSLAIPLGPVRLVSRLAPARVRNSSPVLNPDRIRDLDVAGWVCAADRLRRDTGWRPRHDLASGLRDTLDFYRRRGWL